MTTAFPIALVAVVAVVVWGAGGYAPWAMLTLELAALTLAGALIATVVLRTSGAERRRNKAAGKSRSDVEILSPSSDSSPGGPGFREPLYVLGYPFRRIGPGYIVLALTIWMALSLVPIRASWLATLSPRAALLRASADALLGSEVGATGAPWSLTPFLSYQDLLLWLAYVMLFWVSFHVASSYRSVRRLSLGLVLLGVGSGVYGLAQWLSRLSEAGSTSAASSLVATGTFGNRNHYAFFQEMLLLVGIGWLALGFREAYRRARDRTSEQEAKARSALFALAVSCIGIGLVFSLSRSGITFALVAGAFYFYATREKGASRPVLAFVAAGLLAATLWIGIDPVVSRFEEVTEEIAMGPDNRVTVWRDSLAAVSDFWLTGSGLSSFQYVYPLYRSFGGRRFYSWAHNDYLQLAIELGLPGLLLAGAIGLWIVLRAGRVRRELAGQRGLLNLHTGYCAAALAVALHSFTDFGLHLPANAALFSVVLGVATGMSPARRSSKSPEVVTKKESLRRSPPAAIPLEG